MPYNPITMAKILIIDDNQNLLKLYEQEFGDLGYEIITSSNASQALAMCIEEVPDLVVLDISMPDTDGIILLGKILARNRSLPVILNSAYASFKSNFMTWCADGFVEKSGDLTELKNKISHILRSRGQALPPKSVSHQA